MVACILIVRWLNHLFIFWIFVRISVISVKKSFAMFCAWTQILILNAAHGNETEQTSNEKKNYDYSDCFFVAVITNKTIEARIKPLLFIYQPQIIMKSVRNGKCIFTGDDLVRAFASFVKKILSRSTDSIMWTINLMAFHFNAGWLRCLNCPCDYGIRQHSLNIATRIFVQ